MLERVWRKGYLLHCWWECKLVQPLWRTMWRVLKKLEIVLPYDPAIPLLGINTKETRHERDTCTPMFIATLFIIARTWKQPRCPSADEWTNSRFLTDLSKKTVHQENNGCLSQQRKTIEITGTKVNYRIEVTFREGNGLMCQSSTKLCLKGPM